MALTRAHLRKGFTLIEIMTAVSIFIVVLTISSGAIISVFDANRKAQTLRSSLNNLNLAIEAMSREMRFGKAYHCLNSGTLTTPNNCPSGGSFISFLSTGNQQMVYKLNGTTIERSTDGGVTYIPMTSPDVVVQNLSFYVLGAGPVPTNTLQPKVLVVLKGYVGNSVKTRTDFSVQTLVSQRTLDNS